VSTTILPDVASRPVWRGRSHAYAFFAALLGGVVLVALAPDGRARLALGVYAVSMAGLFGVSALYHRIPWRSAAKRAWMRRADHSMIFLLIAGTYTPFALLVLEGSLRRSSSRCGPARPEASSSSSCGSTPPSGWAR
jgi:hemolysin III